MMANKRTARPVVLAIALASAALVGGCGGGDSDDQGTTVPGAGNAGAGAPESGRNVVRVPGQSVTDVAAAADLLAYPPQQGKVPSGWILFPREDWRRAVLAAQFVAAPVNGALLPTELEYLPTAAKDLLSRSQPPGFPRGPKLQALFMGEPGDEIVFDFQKQQQALTRLAQDDPNELAAELVAYRGGWSETFSDDILIVSGEDDDRPYALIAASWSAFTGDTVAFVEGDEIPEATQALLEQRQKLRLIKPDIWVIGPDSAVSESAEEELAGFAKEVHRVEGEGPVETAVAMARLRDEPTGFGWGLNAAPINIALVNLEDWGNAAGAWQLAGSGPRAALLLTDSPDELPEPVAEYLRETQRKEPSQGYVLGDRESISSPQLAELDELLNAKQGVGAEAGEASESENSKSEGFKPGEKAKSKQTGG